MLEKKLQNFIETSSVYSLTSGLNLSTKDIKIAENSGLSFGFEAEVIISNYDELISDNENNWEGATWDDLPDYMQEDIRDSFENNNFNRATDDEYFKHLIETIGLEKTLDKFFVEPNYGWLWKPDSKLAIAFAIPKDEFFSTRIRNKRHLELIEDLLKEEFSELTEEDYERAGNISIIWHGGDLVDKAELLKILKNETNKEFNSLEEIADYIFDDNKIEDFSDNSLDKLLDLWSRVFLRFAKIKNEELKGINSVYLSSLSPRFLEVIDDKTNYDEIKDNSSFESDFSELEELLVNYNDTRMDEEFNEYINNLDSSYLESIMIDYEEDTRGLHNPDNIKLAVDFVASEVEKMFPTFEVDRVYAYHGKVKNKKNFTVEPDGSVRKGAEIVSPVFYDFKIGLSALKNLLDDLSESGLGTNYDTGLHINIGEFDPSKIDWLKVTLLSGESNILSSFGRTNNDYSRSLIQSLKINLSTSNNKSLTKEYLKIIQSLNKELLDRPQRESAINLTKMQKGYIEFRAMGGEDYHKKWKEIKRNILTYAYLLTAGQDPNILKKEYIKKLSILLESSRSRFQGNYPELDKILPGYNDYINNIKNLDGKISLSQDRNIIDVVFHMGKAFASLVATVHEINSKINGPNFVSNVSFSISLIYLALNNFPINVSTKFLKTFKEKIIEPLKDTGRFKDKSNINHYALIWNENYFKKSLNLRPNRKTKLLFGDMV